MSYYDNDKEYAARGIDYDLGACLEYNPQDGFGLDDIKQVLAVYEGENEERDWRWVLELNDGRFVYLQGGCDYTGWDCQSWASHRVCATALEAAKQPDASQYHDDAEQRAVNISLIAQLKAGKDTTWREQMDVLFPDVPKISRKSPGGEA